MYVLVLLNKGTHRQWVTWAKGFPEGDHFYGHYFDDEAEAWEDFGKRCQDVCKDIANLIRRNQHKPESHLREVHKV